MNHREALSQALKSFGVTSYVIYGDVSDEETYNQYVRETIGINEETNESILSEGPSISWELIEPKYKEELNKIPFEKLREIRNKYLSDCDWTRMDDNQLSDLKKSEWEVYRQQLRDLTKTSSPKLDQYGMLDFSSVDWPVKPQ